MEGDKNRFISRTNLTYHTDTTHNECTRLLLLSSKEFKMPSELGSSQATKNGMTCSLSEYLPIYERRKRGKRENCCLFSGVVKPAPEQNVPVLTV